ncbi:L-type lectin-domain containing receptor kinase IX.2-like [Populus alba x Populus x berolinensis]|uniref:L-type lectin-domain containing receptor kinase IX.2-like n=1 Tax=Populus alba x Populus x berolinensis TaxID=444605 RepID=A0AAD6PVT1_9ROSI|nr:L-type lectin-domain containing receptor kinase IX.2-like [Populus alba x Populus x berolinensis]
MDESCPNPRKFSYQTLACATNNFSEKDKLGEGATGSVFKGFLRELSCSVAVKRIAFGSKYGDSPPDMGSAKDHRPGLASALLYLHEEREQSVLHCDIKSDNILLDSNFGPKLCDFGLARPAEDEQESGYPTVLTGAPGYLAPECKTSGKATKESDIYSFGVVVLQMACGKPAVEQFQENGMKFELKLVDWVCEKIERGENVSAVADPRLGLSYDEKEMEQLIFVGLSCVNPNPYDRPSIWELIKMLKC